MIIKLHGPISFATVEDGPITLQPGEWAEVEQLDGKFRRVTGRGADWSPAGPQEATTLRGIHPDATGRVISLWWCKDCRMPCDKLEPPRCRLTGLSCVPREPITIG